MGLRGRTHSYIGEKLMSQSLNREETKPWWKSKTLWGLAVTAISILAPKYQPIADALPALVDQVGITVGLILGFYGRIVAKQPLR